MKTEKIIIAGGRDFDDYDGLAKTCDRILSNIVCNKFNIISGGARGADKVGERYAERRCYDLTRMLAKWDEFGKKAGYIRNVAMADKADRLIAFWDGRSKGTKNMIDIAREKKIPVHIITYKSK